MGRYLVVVSTRRNTFYSKLLFHRGIPYVNFIYLWVTYLISSLNNLGVLNLRTIVAFYLSMITLVLDIVIFLILIFCKMIDLT